MRLVGGYFYLDFALADWAFAADLARDDVAGLDAVLERFTAEVTRRAAATAMPTRCSSRR